MIALSEVEGLILSLAEGLTYLNISDKVLSKKNPFHQ